MEIKILVSEPEHLEFIISGMRHTVPNLLRETLLNDSKVEFVSYTLKHPLDKESKFIIKTKGKSAKKALSEALSAIDSDLTDFRQNVKKALK